MAEFGNGSPQYICRICQTPLASADHLLSKSFKGKSGPAYFFSQAMNIVEGQKQKRQLITGSYKISDIHCINCGQILGWKYLKAYDLNQKFKEGKFIIERAKILKQY